MNVITCDEIRQARKNTLLELSEFFPEEIRAALQNIDLSIAKGVEEIRLRAQRPLMVVTNEGDYFISDEGRAVAKPYLARIVSQRDVFEAFQLICEQSVYAYQNDINSGFITLKGGHRVGLCGKVVVENNKVVNLKEISGVNLRISRELKSCAEPIIDKILKGNRDVYNTVIISPPRLGKTTLLRDMSRIVSNGSLKHGFKGIKVGLIDERYEIAACYGGIPQNDIGIRTDVISGCPKDLAMEMLLRSMSPELIVVDELGAKKDIDALLTLNKAGVRVFGSIHGNNLEEVKKREITR